ncbi:zona pellucida sperm-binding protein 3-like [Anarhichas minor]|uniref:zona pellucida sperm-binding protein 3-like n=1 Tax=Anarhichas minor TaxID=65739 RepID=UPI003F731E3A
MVMKCTAVCLMALTLLGSFCDAQYQKPGKPLVDLQQTRQSFEKPLTWRYPTDPKPEVPVDVPFELRHPVPAATVAVDCREKITHVEVKKDLFGTGQYINPADLTLGNCGAVGEDNNAQVLIYEAELQECLSSLAMTEDSLIYTFMLNYVPRPLGGSPVVRTSQAAVIVECHYPRKHNVSSLGLDPQWIPFSAVKVAEEFLYFTLKLMTDNWQYERPSYQYYLGDVINIQAVVKQYFHVPLRVYVDSCVATLSPDMSSSPRYAFIDHNGCLLDGRITGSGSRFTSRSADNALQFQLEAFKFQGSDSGMLYITCHLKATCATHLIDESHRACSWNNGWMEASGINGVCGSCEVPGLGHPHTSTGTGIGTGTGTGSGTGTGTGTGSWLTPGRKVRDVSESEVVEWEGDVTLGPIPISERMV